MDLQPEKRVQPWTSEEEGATVDLGRRCNSGPGKKVQQSTWEEGATVDLRRRCHRGPEKKKVPPRTEKKVPPWT